MGERKEGSENEYFAKHALSSTHRKEHQQPKPQQQHPQKPRTFDYKPPNAADYNARQESNNTVHAPANPLCYRIYQRKHREHEQSGQ